MQYIELKEMNFHARHGVMEQEQERTVGNIHNFFVISFAQSKIVAIFATVFGKIKNKAKEYV